MKPTFFQKQKTRAFLLFRGHVFLELSHWFVVTEIFSRTSGSDFLEIHGSEPQIETFFNRHFLDTECTIFAWSLNHKSAVVCVAITCERSQTRICGSEPTMQKKVRRKSGWIPFRIVDQRFLEKILVGNSGWEAL